MHMADALISPAVGGTMWAVSAGMIVHCARKVKQTLDDRLVPMMGVLGAFVFAVQMINFSIPGTGSSGHLTGGLILAILLGPHAAFLVIASVITVQALFFADGGLLALGCNIFNMGFWSIFITYPLLYRRIAGNDGRSSRAWFGSILAAVVGLQFGAFGVVLETTCSGISELPFGIFVLLMQPIHLAIGIVEGLATAAVVSFLAQARPEVLQTQRARSIRPAFVSLAVAAAVIAAVISWFASTHPDGLEWSIARTTGKDELSATSDWFHRQVAHIQEKTAFLPDYGFKEDGNSEENKEANSGKVKSWPDVNAGTSIAGLVGGVMTLALAGGMGWVLRKRKDSCQEM